MCCLAGWLGIGGCYDNVAGVTTAGASRPVDDKIEGVGICSIGGSGGRVDTAIFSIDCDGSYSVDDISRGSDIIDQRDYLIWRCPANDERSPLHSTECFFIYAYRSINIFK